MKWLALTLRVLVGLMMVLAGIVYFVMGMPPPEGMPEAAGLGAWLETTKWMTVVKVLEVVGGLILLGGRYVPLGLVILIPVTVNIAIWDALVMKFSMPPAGCVLLAMELLLVWCYWPTFAPFFRAKAPLRGGSI